MPSNLTERQKRFCDEYLIDLNATQAAIRAGYSEKTAEQMGYQLLQKTSVQEYLQKRLSDRSERTAITQDMVLDELAKVGFAKAADYTDADLKYSNKLRALELLGKHLGMFGKAPEESSMEDLAPLAEMLKDEENTEN